VHSALPPNLLNPAPTSPGKVDFDNQETEHAHFKRLFDVWDACSNVETMADDEGRGGFDFTLGLSDVAATVDAFGGGWKKRFKTRVDEVRSMVVDLLTFGWLLLAIDPEDQSQRAQELRKIRKIFIPELMMRLTGVLQKARKHYPEYVEPFFWPSLGVDYTL
jgi:nuclear pore complex protein Nup107